MSRNVWSAARLIDQGAAWPWRRRAGKLRPASAPRVEKSSHWSFQLIRQVAAAGSEQAGGVEPVASLASG
jgi:hypothetical protein